MMLKQLVVRINRIKEVLQEKQKTNKWLAKELDVNYVTVSRWCTNIYQPNLETLIRIADLLNVDIKELLNSTKND